MSRRVVEAEEPEDVETFGPELAIERLRKGIVGRLARAGEVQRHPMHPGPEIQLLGDELRPVIHPDAFRAAMDRRDPLQRGHHIGAAIAQPYVDRRRDPGEVVDDGQNADLAAGEQLVGQEVHRPTLVRRRGNHAVLALFRRDLPFRCLPAQLQTLLPVEPSCPLVIDAPAFPSKQDVDTPIAISHAALGQLVDAFAETGLLGTAMPVVVRRAVETKSTTGTPDADPVTGAQIFDQVPGPSRLHNLWDGPPRSSGRDLDANQGNSDQPRHLRRPVVVVAKTENLDAT